MTSRKAANKSGGSTREQVLGAACKVFAENGFRDATIADICERARANIAAVNYYFRDKGSLYVEAWRAAFQRSVEAYPPDGGVPADAPPAERLRGRVGSLMSRVHDRDNYEFRIVQKELANPTGLLDEVVRECIAPMRQGMADVVRELLGPDVPDVQVMLCTRSIGSQCLHMLMHGHGRL
ncbi:MAG: CerR family C-terminal domain-containing protein, partial [Planctomycetota bacterium]